MSNLITRALSGIFIVVAVLYTTIKGGPILLLANCLLSVIASIELYSAFRKLGIRYSLIVQLPFAVILSILAYFNLYSYMIASLLLVFLYAFIEICLGHKYRISDMLVFLFAILYANLLNATFLLIDDYRYALFVYACAWGTDTFAYVVGLLFGKHKLIESLSPNKTVEGALGGILGSIVISLVLRHFYELEGFALFIVLAIFTSIMSQFGDLCASYIKRRVKIKDFGNIILGHGGVLDRFDSVLFATPVVYVLYLIFGR